MTNCYIALFDVTSSKVFKKWQCACLNFTSLEYKKKPKEFHQFEFDGQGNKAKR